MGIRPAKCYRDFKRPWTRQSRKKPKKGYVKGVPFPKITKFQFGNAKRSFGLKASLVSEHDVQIRHNSLEAARVSINKVLEKELGLENYFMKMRVFPHHVIRENAMATGAGADRFQSGMRLSFGHPIGTAARVHRGQAVAEVLVDPSKEAVARKALRVAKSKLPLTYAIEVERAKNN
ncbi:MAG: 50S ribosomal protein L16 [Candidatus Aenigmarchaeota archaeon]|nr:50S ribosomal protein L16 [Candidatus Aenigmarchaeota archaeon]